MKNTSLRSTALVPLSLEFGADEIIRRTDIRAGAGTVPLVRCATWLDPSYQPQRLYSNIKTSEVALMARQVKWLSFRPAPIWWADKARAENPVAATLPEVLRARCEPFSDLIDAQALQ